MSEPTKEQKARWAKMARWERATERVEKLEWEINDLKKALKLARKNLKFAHERNTEAKAALGELSVLESAC